MGRGGARRRNDAGGPEARELAAGQRLHLPLPPSPPRPLSRGREGSFKPFRNQKGSVHVRDHSVPHARGTDGPSSSSPRPFAAGQPPAVRSSSVAAPSRTSRTASRLTIRL